MVEKKIALGKYTVYPPQPHKASPRTFTVNVVHAQNEGRAADKSALKPKIKASNEGKMVVQEKKARPTVGMMVYQPLPMEIVSQSTKITFENPWSGLSWPDRRWVTVQLKKSNAPVPQRHQVQKKKGQGREVSSQPPKLAAYTLQRDALKKKQTMNRRKNEKRN